MRDAEVPTSGLLRALQIAAASCSITDTRTTSDPRWRGSRLDSDPEEWPLVRSELLEEGDKWTSRLLYTATQTDSECDRV